MNFQTSHREIRQLAQFYECTDTPYLYYGCLGIKNNEKTHIFFNRDFRPMKMAFPTMMGVASRKLRKICVFRTFII